jgi:hypothetical protein
VFFPFAVALPPLHSSSTDLNPPTNTHPDTIFFYPGEYTQRGSRLDAYTYILWIPLLRSSSSPSFRMPRGTWIVSLAYFPISIPHLSSLPRSMKSGLGGLTTVFTFKWKNIHGRKRRKLMNVTTSSYTLFFCTLLFYYHPFLFTSSCRSSQTCQPSSSFFL